MRCPEGPGFGVELDMEAIRRHTLAELK
jgi:hypothetical protein